MRRFIKIFNKKFLAIFAVFLFNVGVKFYSYNINRKMKADTILHRLHSIFKINKSVKSKFRPILKKLVFTDADT